MSVWIWRCVVLVLSCLVSCIYFHWWKSTRFNDTKHNFSAFSCSHGSYYSSRIHTVWVNCVEITTTNCHCSACIFFHDAYERKRGNTWNASYDRQTLVADTNISIASTNFLQFRNAENSSCASWNSTHFVPFYAFVSSNGVSMMPKLALTKVKFSF